MVNETLEESLVADARMVRFTNCYLIEPESGDLTPCTASLWVDRLSGIVARVVLDDSSAVNCFVPESGEGGSFEEALLASAPTVDLDGQILAPGLIDIQINGAYGIDFSHWPGDEADYIRAVEAVSARLVETGVTAYLPTVIASERFSIESSVHLLTRYSVAVSNARYVRTDRSSPPSPRNRLSGLRHPGDWLPSGRSILGSFEDWLSSC
jgi:hypothetical protein